VIVRADAAAAAVLAIAPLAVTSMLADARAPAVLAVAPLAVMLANARTPAVLASDEQVMHTVLAPPQASPPLQLRDL